MIPFTPCPECRHLREERAAIDQFCGGATREDAERRAALIFCPEHQPIPTTQDLFAEVR